MHFPDFQMAWHDSVDYPEWGSAAKRPLVQFDMAHKGEWMDSVIGPDPATGKDMIYHIVRCELCIAIHAWPLPSEEALTQYYSEHFYQHEKPDMIDRYLADKDWWAQCMHGPLLDAALNALQATVEYAPIILDVGAGPGLLLQQAQERDWFTVAIEPSPLCAERLRAAGHYVSEKSLTAYIHSSTHALQSYYDIVTMWETLEHVPHPEETLLQVYDLLRPGGVLGICVPNEYTPAQYAACKRFGLAHWWVQPPQHLWYWTPKTLQLVLRRCGFQLVDSWTTFPMIEYFLLQEDRCYVGNDALGRACHQERMALELEVAQHGYWHLWMQHRRERVERRSGREFVVIARKES